MLAGDQNSWTGNSGRYGIEGNRAETNANGDLLIAFLTIHDLELANNSPLASGKFTRYPYGAGLPSILDLVCLDNNLFHSLTEFTIDEENINEIRSDHRLVTMTFKLHEYYTPAKYVQWQPKFKIHPQSHEDFSSRLDKELMKYEIFKTQSCEAMYTEFTRSMQKVGLTVGKSKSRFKHKRPKGKLLKRLKKN